MHQRLHTRAQAQYVYTCACIHICIWEYMYIYIWSPARPAMTNHPLQNIAPTGFFRGIEFEPFERVCGTARGPRPKKQSCKDNAGPVLFFVVVLVVFSVFVLYFCVFCILFFVVFGRCFFGFLWVCSGMRSVSQHQEMKIPKHQKTKTKHYKNRQTKYQQKSNNTNQQNRSRILRGALAFVFSSRSSGG